MMFDFFAETKTKGVQNMIYVSNAFSLQMQGCNECVSHPATREEAQEALCPIISGDMERKEKYWGRGVWVRPATSVIGHSDICAMINSQLGLGGRVDVEGADDAYTCNRASISLKPGDTLWVGQYVGQRLPEGCTTLPEGARVDWYVVECRKSGAIARLEEIRSDLANAAADFEWPDVGEKTLKSVVEKHFPQYFSENAFD
jgi:hypothetical protein